VGIDADALLKQVRPTESVITKLEVTLDERTPGTTLAALRVSMAKRGGRWLVTDAEFREPVRAGR
jgi:hypothetical protein